MTPREARRAAKRPLAGAHIPRELKDRLDALSRTSGVPRSTLIEGAVRRLLDEIEGRDLLGVPARGEGTQQP